MEAKIVLLDALDDQVKRTQIVPLTVPLDISAKKALVMERRKSAMACIKSPRNVVVSTSTVHVGVQVPRPCLRAITRREKPSIPKGGRIYVSEDITVKGLVDISALREDTETKKV